MQTLKPNALKKLKIKLLNPVLKNYICTYFQLCFILSKKGQNCYTQLYSYEVGSITNANGLISQQIRNIAKKFKKAATTTFICLSTCLPVVQVTGPRSDFVCRRAAGNEATKGVCVCAGQTQHTAKQIHCCQRQHCEWRVYH